MMKPINVTDSNSLIEMGYGLMKKDGTLWKNRIDWTKLVDKLIETNFGTYTLVSEEKIDKDWYWTLKDSLSLFKIKRDKARKNKNLPKDIEVLDRKINKGVENVVKEIMVKHFNYQLCLPQPRELVDVLLDEVNKVRVANGVCVIGENARFKVKVNSILSLACTKGNTPQERKQSFKEMSKRLMTEYHPDRNSQDTTSKFQDIQKTVDNLRKREKFTR